MSRRLVVAVAIAVIGWRASSRRRYHDVFEKLRVFCSDLDVFLDLDPVLLFEFLFVCGLHVKGTGMRVQYNEIGLFQCTPSNLNVPRVGVNGARVLRKRQCKCLVVEMLE